MTKPQEVAYIQPPRILQDKVLHSEDGSPNFDDAVHIIASMGEEFSLRLPQEICAIEQDLIKLKAEPNTTALRMVLFRRVHDLKGQAGTYNYWMITVIGNELCRFIEHSKILTPRHLKLMRYHVEAMKMVVQKNLVGKNPEGGQKMIDTLHTMAGKVLQD